MKVLRAFFEAERGFFLSGGGALVGFHLGHRTTTDLDLFTTSPEAFERARRVLPVVLAALGATSTVVQDAPGFRRLVIHSPSDGDLVVDLVRDVGPQLHPKVEVDGIIVDPIEEIFANKLTTLVSRQEVRDLIDVLELERRGLRVEDFLAEASAKDGGATPATMAWLLGQWTVGPEVPLPPGYTHEEVDAFRVSLVDRLSRAARP